MAVDRKHAGAVLKRIARLLELHGENPYRVRAFANAGRVVERIEGDLEALISSGKILEIRGVGRGTAGALQELVADGSPQLLLELEDRTPAGVVKMLGLSGLGPKKVRTIWQELGATTLGELEYACQENRLAELKGFGPRAQEAVLEAVRFSLRAGERMLVHAAASAADGLVAELAAVAGVQRVEVAGELRRGCETISRLEVVVMADDRDAVSRWLQSQRTGFEEIGNQTWRATDHDGKDLLLRLTDHHQLGATLLWATGSENHCKELAGRAKRLGMQLEETGLRRADEVVAASTESEIYQALGCQWVPPELREGEGEVDNAAASQLPVLVQAEELRGALHNHTQDSDGSASLAQMASAASALGWRYFGVADHSPVAVYANGVDGDRLREQGRRADELNRAGSVARVVKGLEADILSDGSLDIPQGAEDGLDYVVASVHSAFHLDVEAQTNRIVSAVRHPACRVLGHPTGRLLLARPGFEVDLDAVLDACAEHRVAVEINASPYRLDLDWRWARKAIERGVMLVVNPDAHSTGGLEHLRWGLAVARKAGARATDLLNCLEYEALLEWMKR